MEKVISRKEAKELGLEYYFTGKPCLNGGISKRSTKHKYCLCDMCKEVANAKKRKNYDWSKKREYYDKNKEAIAKRNKNRYESKKEEINAKRKIYRDSNKNEINEKQKQYYWANKDKLNEARKEYVKDNMHIFRANNIKRKASKAQRTPIWFNELDQFVMQEADRLCKSREKLHGFKWHIDHMIPLRAKEASGLHCAVNIQVIPQTINNAKRNKMIFTEPLEWLKPNTSQQS